MPPQVIRFFTPASSAPARAARAARDTTLGYRNEAAGFAGQTGGDAQAVEMARQQVDAINAALPGRVTTELSSQVPPAVAAQVASQVDPKVTAAQAAAAAAEQSKQDAQSSALVNGSFTSLALATAAIGSLAEGHSYEVTADSTASNIGIWTKRSGVLVQTSTVTVQGLAARTTTVEAIFPPIGPDFPSTGLVPLRLAGATPEAKWVIDWLTAAGLLDFLPSPELIQRITGSLAVTVAAHSAVTDRFRLTALMDLPDWPYAIIVSDSVTGIPFIPLLVREAGHPDAGKVFAQFDSATLAAIGAGGASASGQFSQSEKAPKLAYQLSVDAGVYRRYVYRDGTVAPVVAIHATGGRLVLVAVGGQSNAIGTGSLAPWTTTPPFPHNVLMLTGGPDGGPRWGSTSPLDLSDKALDFVAAREYVRETPVTAYMAFAAALRSTRDAYAGVTYGVGGMTLAQCSKGTEQYANGLRLIERMVKNAMSYGFAEAVMFDHGFIQGEADRSGTPRATYVTQGITYKGDIEADVKALTNQREPVWWSQVQLAAAPGNIADAWTALAQLDLVTQAPRAQIACPSYFMINDTAGPTGVNYGMDGVHYLEAGHALQGDYLGKAHGIIRSAIEAVPLSDDPSALDADDISTCLRPDPGGIWRVGSDLFIGLKLAADGPSVVIDTVALPAATMYGYEKIAGTGGALTSVAIATNQTNPNNGRVFPYAVKATMASPGTATLRYAYTPDPAFNAKFTASISGTVMTVTAVTSGTIVNGAAVSSSSFIAPGTVVVSGGTGTGGVGTYNLNISQTVASRDMQSGTTDRPAAWGNIRDTCTKPSRSIPGLLLRNWLVVHDAVFS